MDKQRQNYLCSSEGTVVVTRPEHCTAVSCSLKECNVLQGQIILNVIISCQWCKPTSQQDTHLFKGTSITLYHSINHQKIPNCFSFNSCKSPFPHFQIQFSNCNVTTVPFLPFCQRCLVFLELPCSPSGFSLCLQETCGTCQRGMAWLQSTRCSFCGSCFTWKRRRKKIHQK